MVKIMKKFVITIARGYGSGGRTIGKMLAVQLGVKYYDRELLRLASDDSGINEALFAKADEKVKNTLLFSTAKKVYTGEIIPPDQEDFVSNDNLFNYQAKIITELAEQESCVIIGRCADFVLKDRKDVIRIFVHAPLESCIKRLEGMYSVSTKELEKKIKSIDKNRAMYYKYYTGKEWNSAENYDLCINTNELSFEQAVEIVKEYMKIKLR